MKKGGEWEGECRRGEWDGECRKGENEKVNVERREWEEKIWKENARRKRMNE